MTAGMEMVVGMAYSVTVTAATLMITKLYTDLFGGKTIDEALRLSSWQFRTLCLRRRGTVCGIS